MWSVYNNVLDWEITTHAGIVLALNDLGVGERQGAVDKFAAVKELIRGEMSFLRNQDTNPGVPEVFLPAQVNDVLTSLESPPNEEESKEEEVNELPSESPVTSPDERTLDRWKSIPGPNELPMRSWREKAVTQKGATLLKLLTLETYLRDATVDKVADTLKPGGDIATLLATSESMRKELMEQWRRNGVTSGLDLVTLTSSEMGSPTEVDQPEDDTNSMDDSSSFISVFSNPSNAGIVKLAPTALPAQPHFSDMPPTAATMSNLTMSPSEPYTKLSIRMANEDAPLFRSAAGFETDVKVRKSTIKVQGAAALRALITVAMRDTLHVDPASIIFFSKDSNEVFTMAIYVWTRAYALPSSISSFVEAVRQLLPYKDVAPIITVEQVTRDDLDANRDNRLASIASIPPVSEEGAARADEVVGDLEVKLREVWAHLGGVLSDEAPTLDVAFDVGGSSLQVDAVYHGEGKPSTRVLKQESDGLLCDERDRLDPEYVPVSMMDRYTAACERITVLVANSERYASTASPDVRRTLGGELFGSQEKRMTARKSYLVALNAQRQAGYDALKDMLQVMETDHGRVLLHFRNIKGRRVMASNVHATGKLKSVDVQPGTLYLTSGKVMLTFPTRSTMGRGERPDRLLELGGGCLRIG